MDVEKIKQILQEVIENESITLGMHFASHGLDHNVATAAFCLYLYEILKATKRIGREVPREETDKLVQMFTLAVNRFHASN